MKTDTVKDSTRKPSPGITKLDATPEKINIAEAFKLRYHNKLTYKQIGEYFGCSAQAVHERLSKFAAMLLDPDELKAFRDNKSAILSSVEFKLLGKLLDEETLKGASLNNAAYAFQQIYNANRLETGKSTSNVSIHITEEHRLIAEEVVNKIAQSEIEKLRAEKQDPC